VGHTVRGVTDTVEQKIVVRAAEAADAPAIARTHIRSREVAMPWLPPRKRSDAEVERWVREVMLAEADVWVAADGGGTVLGYAAVEGEWLEHLYLLPEVRRRGIGSLLLARAKEHRPRRLDLHVFQRNTGARAFYARHGFTVVDMNDGSRNMEHEPDMTLRWTPVTNSTPTDG
jgi:ribosomal protein S18 acetylase RimI-like enzyme